MTKCVSYSLFGIGRPTPPNTFEFSSYLRGLMVNVRVNRLIYPNWVNVVHTDKETYTSKYKEIFDWLIDNGFIEVVICPSNEALTKAMLWRVKPVFETVDGAWRFSHIICRDIDSVCTYREAQAVQAWINEGKAIHCITDSISHNVAMMGGMIGIATQTFADRMNCRTWEQLMDLSQGINYNNKGADQEFMNRYVYPKCADSATEHFVLGMVRNLAEGNGRHYSIEDIIIPINVKYKVINDCAGHCGAAGYYESPMVHFLNVIDPYGKEYLEIERKFPHLFFWSS